MTYQACDIDKLRDLVVRQEYAKNDYYYEMGMYPRGWKLDPMIVERQLNTYMGEGTTVAALTKCVEEIEAETKARVTKERERAERRTKKQQAHRVLDTAIDLASKQKEAVTINRPGTYSSYATEDFACAARAVKEWIGDPWDDDDAS